MEIPSDQDWGDINGGADVKSAYHIAGGKSREDVMAGFYRDVLSRVAELRFMPPKPFAYYMLAFQDYVERRDYRRFTEADVANSFLELIQYRLMHDRASIEFVMPLLMPTIEWLAASQDEFDAPIEIYGSFQQRAESIMELTGLG